MRDYKRAAGKATATRFTRSKVKPNRKKPEPKPPRDWKKILQRSAATARLLAIVAVIAGTLALLVGGSRYLIYDSQFFRVESVQIEPGSRIDAATIAELSGIRRGVSMFDLDLAAIGTQIEANPWIAAAQVERIFPRTVTIRVSEYVPVAMVNLDCLWYVAEDGTVFKRLEPGDKIDFLLLTGVTQKDILERPEETRQLLAGAVTLQRELAGRKVFNLTKVSEINLNPADGYAMMTLNGGVPVRIGFDDFAVKLTRLERIYPELESRLSVTQYIDLNGTDRVVVKLDPILNQKPQKVSKS